MMRLCLKYIHILVVIFLSTIIILVSTHSQNEAHKLQYCSNVLEIVYSQ